ncbi:hypothetical protein Tfer_1085 [Thermincola ferriacetica]|uniref:Permease n=1 Tax=Thermincola ferriacetica TaxID=281456 RepID=A0A0L6W531_9FIRM|nr:hypothetical protein Tfer_1085 [Thermincola ferriacetica]
MGLSSPLFNGDKAVKGLQLTRKKIYRLIFLITVPVLTGYLLYRVRRIIIPFALAVLIAYLLNPFVNMLESRRLPRGIAILLVYALVFVFITGLVTVGIPAIMDELTSFARAVPHFTGEVQSIVHEAEARYSRFVLPDPVKKVFDQKIKLVEAQLISLTGELAEGVVGIFSHLFSLIIAPVFAFYLLKDSGNIKKNFLALLPAGWRNDVQALTVDINEIFSKYIRGHLLVCVIVGFLTGVGYALVGLEYAFILGIFAGIADLVPYFGPFIGALPALMLALLESRVMALKVLIMVLVIQQIENSVISPKIIGDSLGLSPLVVIIVLMAGGELYGLLGLLLAVPVTAVLKCLIRYMYLKLVD